MSLETWKAEFYPVHASVVPAEQALDHSIKKWSGLTQENMDKHGVSYDNVSGYVWTGGYVRTGGSAERSGVHISYESCSLCHNYVVNRCARCPIKKLTGENCNEAYRKFTNYTDPIPMIDLLNSVKAAQCNTTQTSATEHPTSTGTDALVEQPEC